MTKPYNVEDVKLKIDDLSKQIKFNNESNNRMEDQLSSLQDVLVKKLLPDITRVKFNSVLDGMTDLISDILADMSANINDYDAEFEIGYSNEVTLSNINLDYDAADDVRRLLEERNRQWRIYSQQSSASQRWTKHCSNCIRRIRHQCPRHGHQL